MTAGERRKSIICVLCHDRSTRDRDGVCEPCRKDWQKGRDFRSLVKQGGDETHEILHTVDYWYIYAFAGNPRPTYRHDNKSILQKTLLQLAEAQDLETWDWRAGYQPPAETGGEIIGWTENCRKDFHRRKYVARRGSGELLRIAYHCIVDMLAEAHADGAREGQSMLHGLATGKRTVQDFNEWFTGIEDKKE